MMETKKKKKKSEGNKYLKSVNDIEYWGQKRERGHRRIYDQDWQSKWTEV